MNWIRLENLETYPDQELTPLTIGNLDAVLVRRGDEIAIYLDQCTHVDLPVSTGYLYEDNIVCPWHGAQFSAKDGEAICGPAARPLEKFNCKIEHGIVYVATPSAP